MADQQGPPGDSPRPPGSDAPVGFTLDGAQRIVQVVRWVERQVRQPPAQRGRFPLAQPNYLRLALTTSTITGRSGTTAGSGSANLYHYSGTSLVVDSNPGITVSSPFATAISSGKWIIVNVISGQYTLVSADC